MSDDAKDAKDTRSATQIESDLARTRAELTSTVNELSEMLDPRKQVENAKNSVREAVDRTSASARQTVEDLRVQAKNFLEDVKGGDPKSVGFLGAGVAVALTALVVRVKRGR
ncbi:DUF3618 domain-containing protein [Georgenia wangjunii]|uniref:DUF3618 domain-containing protein n=1 Tax=Georgenia wangjunii TaxID=3117730 RepID=UPI002F26C0D2